MIPMMEIGARSTLMSPELMVEPTVWLMSPQFEAFTDRRIIAKEWNAERLRSEPIEKSVFPLDDSCDSIGNACGW